MTHCGISDHTMAIGTPRYAAPEQFLGLSVDHRADIYGLSAVLYRLIAGRSPYDGWTFEEVAEKMQRTGVVPLDRACRDHSRPRQLDDLVMAGLARDPARRPQSADVLSESLRRTECTLGGEIARRRWPSSQRCAWGGALFAVGAGIGAAGAALLGL